jgi:hypothetical protein
MTLAKESEVVAKIRKLLELASADRNPSPHEAESAMAKVQELLAKYELEMADIESASETPPEGFERSHDTYFKRKSPQDRFVIWLLELHFHVHVINEGPMLFDGKYVRRNPGFDREKPWPISCYTFYGKPTNVAVARHVFHYLHAEFERQWKRYRKESGDRNQSDFYRGLYEGLSSRLASEQKQQQKTATPAQREGLIKRERNDEGLLRRFIEEIHEDFFRPPRISWNQAMPDPPNAESVAAGHKAGKNINIRPAVNESTGRKALRG